MPGWGVQAPSVESGIHLLYWDSEMEGMLVNSRNMEVQNHWGPVDASAQLPADRIKQFFGQRASYYVPSGSKVGPAMHACRRLTTPWQLVRITRVSVMGSCVDRCRLA